MNYPSIHAKVFHTKKGTPYLKEPGVAMIAQSLPDITQIKKFLTGFHKSLEFPKYLKDPDKINPSAQLIKIAGQTCYMSFAPGRTWNKDADKYISRLIESGHGSVLEHPNYTFLIYGISRSITHELVRHRAGMAYSQQSQRYVGGKVLRFIERPEFQSKKSLHSQFEKRIDRAAREYEALTDKLLKMQEEGEKIVDAEYATDKRKRVRQAARAVLPNETEAVIVATGNARAWRHIINMRAADHAEIEIRRMAFKVYQCLVKVDPITFGDFRVVNLPDGTKAVKTDYPKV